MPVITTTKVASNINDLRDDEFHIVATRSGKGAWEWSMPPGHVSVFIDMRDKHGDVTACTGTRDGVEIHYGKLLRVVRGRR